MRLLFDEHLSRRLVDRLADVFPGSAHVSALALLAAADSRIWEVAGTEGILLVTKDADFSVLAARRGPPPVVVLLKLPNCSTATIEGKLRSVRSTLERAVLQGGIALVEVHP